MLHRLDVQRPVLFAKFCTKKREGEALDDERIEMRVEWVSEMVQRFLGVARLIEDEKMRSRAPLLI
jgi:hypothetical protein